MKNNNNEFQMNPNTSIVQTEQILNMLSELLKKLDKKNPFDLLTQKELLACLDISPNTLKSWERAGLKRLEPPIEGTRTVFYQLHDVINFMTN